MGRLSYHPSSHVSVFLGDRPWPNVDMHNEELKARWMLWIYLVPQEWTPRALTWMIRSYNKIIKVNKNGMYLFLESQCPFEPKAEPSTMKRCGEIWDKAIVERSRSRSSEWMHSSLGTTQGEMIDLWYRHYPISTGRTMTSTQCQHPPFRARTGDRGEEEQQGWTQHQALTAVGNKPLYSIYMGLAGIKLVKIL